MKALYWNILWDGPIRYFSKAYLASFEKAETEIRQGSVSSD